jgi:hypothetical protein
MYIIAYTVIRQALIVTSLYSIGGFGFYHFPMKSSLPAKVAYPPTTIYHDVASSTEEPPPSGQRWRNIHRNEALRMRNSRGNETPEQQQKRLEKQREYQKQYRIKKKLGITKKKPSSSSERKQKSRSRKSPDEIIRDRAADTTRRAFFASLRK